MATKEIFINSKEINSFNQLVHYSGSTFSKAYFLTLWRYFTVDDLKDTQHLLVEQHIDDFIPIILDEYYSVTLNKIDVLTKNDISFWTYELLIKKGEKNYARCLSKIYIKENS
ncbi:hypothetical protein [Vagococcus hydrophili]|uniref:Uncharacterized protein n=1 Tax=Vagococcus hydrophili TaxID=2714947 RepID=A0A6G8ARR2_9ENTE|nr:hypothetical protein [Vagococcus hydrophili]QIL47659.1 hypothetical protein G7082_03445 [Vagococcus hydrophili]